MKNRIGTLVITYGKPTWTRVQVGRIIGIGNERCYKVRYANGRVAWIKKEDILFYND